MSAHMRRSAPLVPVAAALAATAPGADAAVIKGRLAGGDLPPRGRGVAAVALLASSTPVRGTGRRVDRLAAVLRVRARGHTGVRLRLTALSTRRTRAAAAARPGFVDEYGGDHQEGGTLSPGETEAGIAVAGFPLADLTALEAGEAVTRTAAPLGPLPALCHATGPPEDGDCTRGLDFDVTITATREP